MFNKIYKGKKVFVTGHTGFKGSWIVLWLLKLGSNVLGFALPPPTQPNHHEVLDLDFESTVGDIREFRTLCRSIKSFRPDIVFHLAAQAIVSESYQNPMDTFGTNVMGTVNVFEACRQTDSVRAIVNVTSDKCYENREWIWGYRENDPLGGHDPYSASKGCAELVTTSYRKSFFPLKEYKKKHQTLVTSVRAGNVVGGGDWGKDRLVPDIMQASGQNRKVIIRNPQATRPWQHVLEPLAGYLFLGQRILEGKKGFSGAWNFCPNDEGHMHVLGVVEKLQCHWTKIAFETGKNNKKHYEANLLKLDCSKANTKLGWRSVWDSSTTFLKTAQWYREYYESGSVISEQQLAGYIEDAKQKKLPWAMR